MMPMNAIERARQIKKLRQERGWTQKELARRAEISESAISAAETARGKTRPGNLLKICKALEVEPDVLLGDGPRPGDARFPASKAGLASLLEEYLRTQKELYLCLFDRLGLEERSSSDLSDLTDPPSRGPGGGPRVTRSRKS
jgi:transcriptional regulator with XRE-family HTH domain